MKEGLPLIWRSAVIKPSFINEKTGEWHVGVGGGMLNPYREGGPFSHEVCVKRMQKNPSRNVSLARAVYEIQKSPKNH